VKLKRKIVSINLKIIDDTGAPVTGAKVTATGIDVSFTQQASSVEGVSALTLPYGTYRVCVVMPGYSTYCKVVSAASVAKAGTPIGPMIGLLHPIVNSIKIYKDIVGIDL